MAFGFIKKIFSFGKKKVEEEYVEEPGETGSEETQAEAVAPEQVDEALTETVPEPQPAPIAEPEPEPEPEIVKQSVDVQPEPADILPAVDNIELQESTDSGDLALARNGDYAPDGVFQPTPETAPEPYREEQTPDPLATEPAPEPEIEHEKPEPLLDDGDPAEAHEDAAEQSSPTSATDTETIEEPGEKAADAAENDVSSAQASDTDNKRGKVTIGDEQAPENPPEPEPEPEKKGWLKRLTSGLSRSSKQLTESISGIFTKRKLDEDTLQDLEDVLIQADLGVETAMRITDTLSEGRYGKDISTEEVRAVMGAEITKVLDPVALPLELDLTHKPHVILVVGVNGTGKTTTIGKLAAKLRDAGLKVTLGAGDTFRAAAIEQLKIWADRTGSAFVATKLGADAAGLAYSAYETARDNDSDVVIIDTAGRLQNKTELMDELAKIVRVLQKHDPEAPHTVLQTLDATTGQNALSQVEIFRNVAGVSGLVMTKLDGTARGGILVAIAAKFKLPVYFIGVGEQVDDLEPFSAGDFASAIVGDASVQEEPAQ